MATVIGTITSGPNTGETIEVMIPSVRIPELPEAVPTLELADRVAVYDDSEGKTSQHTLAALRTLILTGGDGAPIPAVVAGDKVEIVAQLSNVAGDDPEHPNKLLVPELAGVLFSLRRNGYGDVLTDEYNVLPSGGFELIDDEIRIGDVFVADTYTLVPTTPGSNPTSSSFITGIATLNDDIGLSAVHRYKLLHPYSTTKNLEITLEDIADYPANIIIPIETTLMGDYKVKVKTRGGQNIYINNTLVQYIWLGVNEFLWLIRGTDGFYVMQASESIFNVGKPSMDFRRRLNTLYAAGGLVYRSREPRLYEWALANDLMISEADWQTDTNKQGLFSSGTITTGANANFRLPNHENRSYRALNKLGDYLSGNSTTDTERPNNKPGVYQNDELKEHRHLLFAGASVSDDAAIAANKRVPFQNETEGIGDFKYKLAGTTLEATLGLSSSVGGPETRAKNIGMLPLINC